MNIMQWNAVEIIWDWLIENLKVPCELFGLDLKKTYGFLICFDIIVYFYWLIVDDGTERSWW